MLISVAKTLPPQRLKAHRSTSEVSIMITRRKLIPAAAGVAALGGLGKFDAAGAQDATPGASPVAAASPVVASIDELPLKNPGQLTVHADQPLYAPWFIDNDPTT